MEENNYRVINYHISCSPFLLGQPPLRNGIEIKCHYSELTFNYRKRWRESFSTPSRRPISDVICCVNAKTNLQWMANKELLNWWYFFNDISSIYRHPQRRRLSVASLAHFKLICSDDGKTFFFIVFLKHPIATGDCIMAAETASSATHKSWWCKFSNNSVACTTPADKEGSAAATALGSRYPPQPLPLAGLSSRQWILLVALKAATDRSGHVLWHHLANGRPRSITWKISLINDILHHGPVAPYLFDDGKL